MGIVSLSLVPDKPTLALINISMDGDSQYPEEIPMGVGAVASYVRENGFAVSIHQCFPDTDKNAVTEAAKIAADVYGFQLNIVNYIHVQAVAEKIRENNPKAFIVLGGPFQSSLAAPILKHETVFDCMVVGEGELTMLDIMQSLAAGDIDLAAVNGIVWRDKTGRVVRNAPRKMIDDLDSLPFIARDFLADLKHVDMNDDGLLESIRVVTSRGCVAQCSFCSVNFYSKLQKGKIWRGRSAKNVVDEIEHLTSTYKARVFNFSDSSFEDPGNVGKQRTRDICNGIIERGIEMSAKVYMRADTMHKREDFDLFRLWKKAGIDVIIIGAEAGSDLELEFYNKRANVQQTIQTIEHLKELDLFYVFVGFIMFGPDSTIATLRENMEFHKRLGLTDNPTHMSNALMLIRDTAVYATLRAEGRVVEAENFWELPKYTFIDPMAERAAKHWDGIYYRYPTTNALNKKLVNTENLISRMTNPMNANIYERFSSEFADFKERYAELKAEFGAIQYNYFHQMLDMIEERRPDTDLQTAGDKFFGSVYDAYYPRYAALYDDFLEELYASNLGLSGLTFRHFRPNVVKEGMQRV